MPQTVGTSLRGVGVAGLVVHDLIERTCDDDAAAQHGGAAADGGANGGGGAFALPSMGFRAKKVLV